MGQTSGAQNGNSALASSSAFSSASGAGGIVGPILNLIGGRRDMNFNASQNRKAQAFANYMSSTSYQRAVADMKAAGLNPMLAFENGGASSPVVAGASHSGGESLGSTALEGLKLKEELEQMRASAEAMESNVKLNKELEGKAAAEAELARVNAARLAADIPRAQTWSDIWSTLGKGVGQVTKNITNPKESMLQGWERDKERFRQLKNWVMEKFTPSSTAKQSNNK